VKRSEINRLVADATKCFHQHGWSLPPNPRWDVTDFGLGNWRASGLVLVNLADEPEYCEKLMYAKKGMNTPAHCHQKKKEDIISRWGTLRVRIWPGHPGEKNLDDAQVKISGEMKRVTPGAFVHLGPGQRITLEPGVFHEFEPITDECIIGEVSTANDDLHDNFFINTDVGRFPGIEEDEDPVVRLISEAA
jgi:D-lyxose ketol-isomerase